MRLNRLQYSNQITCRGVAQPGSAPALGAGGHRFKSCRLLTVCLINYLNQHDLGAVVGADGMMRLFPGQVRIPDVAFISWERYPKGKRRRGEIPTVAPDLVVEILSKGNTPKEMKRKLDEYFQAGVRLVWYVNPAARTVRVYTGPKRSVLLNETKSSAGGAVLPGFTLSIRDWFAEAQRSRGEIVIGGQIHRTAHSSCAWIMQQARRRIQKIISTAWAA